MYGREMMAAIFTSITLRTQKNPMARLCPFGTKRATDISRSDDGNVHGLKVYSTEISVFNNLEIE